MNGGASTAKLVVPEGSSGEGRAAQLAQVSKEFLAFALDSATACVFVWDRGYDCLYANQSASKYAGQSVDKMVGKNIGELLGHVPDLARLWTSRTNLVFQTGELFCIEETMLLGDDIVRKQSVLYPMRNAEGSVFAVGLLYRDVPEDKPTARPAPEGHES